MPVCSKDRDRERDGTPELTRLRQRIQQLEQERDTPQTQNFLEAVKHEAWHQRYRWQQDDQNKTHAQWFWLVGYLAGKALHDVRGKRRHHVVATAAALLNWYESLQE